MKPTLLLPIVPFMLLTNSSLLGIVRDVRCQYGWQKVNITLKVVYNMDKKLYKQHILALIEEVRQLDMRVQPQDTGHINTAIDVLMQRIDQLLQHLVEGK
jgi:hypothetical protein